MPDKIRMKNRKSNRLKNFDYSQNGMYFVTICTKNKEPLFGRIENGKMTLNDLGEIIGKNLLKIDGCFSNVFLDEYVIMPDHIHLIVEIIDNEPVGADLVSALDPMPACDPMHARDILPIHRLTHPAFPANLPPAACQDEASFFLRDSLFLTIRKGYREYQAKRTLP